MKIFLATDHAGYELKEAVRKHLLDKGFTVEDCGAYEFDPYDDYPDFIALAAEGVSKDPEESKAIIFGSSGQGEAIVANKFPGVRAVVFYGGDNRGEIVTLSREHNDANVLSLAGKFLSQEEAKRLVDIWLKEPFRGDARHVRRIEKINHIESSL